MAASGSKDAFLNCSRCPAGAATVPPLRAGNTWRGVKVAAVATCGRGAKDTLSPCGPAPAPQTLSLPCRAPALRTCVAVAMLQHRRQAQ